MTLLLIVYPKQQNCLFHMVDVNQYADDDERKTALDNVREFKKPEPREKKEIPIVYCTPHEHHFRPDTEMLRKKGHRSGGLGSQITFKFYKDKNHEPEEPYDYNKLMNQKLTTKSKPAIKLKNKKPPFKRAAAPKTRTRSVPKVKQVGADVVQPPPPPVIEMVRGNKSRIESKPGEPFIRQKAAMLSSHISQVKDKENDKDKEDKDKDFKLRKKEEFLKDETEETIINAFKKPPRFNELLKKAFTKKAKIDKIEEEEEIVPAISLASFPDLGTAIDQTKPVKKRIAPKKRKEAETSTPLIKARNEPPPPPDTKKLGKRATNFLNEAYKEDLKKFEDQQDKHTRSNKTTLPVEQSINGSISMVKATNLSAAVNPANQLQISHRKVQSTMLAAPGGKKNSKTIMSNRSPQSVGSIPNSQIKTTARTMPTRNQAQFGGQKTDPFQRQSQGDDSRINSLEQQFGQLKGMGSDSRNNNNKMRPMTTQGVNPQQLLQMAQNAPYQQQQKSNSLQPDKQSLQQQNLLQQNQMSQQMSVQQQISLQQSIQGMPSGMSKQQQQQFQKQMSKQQQQQLQSQMVNLINQNPGNFQQKQINQIQSQPGAVVNKQQVQQMRDQGMMQQHLPIQQTQQAPGVNAGQGRNRNDMVAGGSRNDRVVQSKSQGYSAAPEARKGSLPPRAELLAQNNAPRQSKQGSNATAQMQQAIPQENRGRNMIGRGKSSGQNYAQQLQASPGKGRLNQRGLPNNQTLRTMNQQELGVSMPDISFADQQVTTFHRNENRGSLVSIQNDAAAVQQLYRGQQNGSAQMFHPQLQTDNSLLVPQEYTRGDQSSFLSGMSAFNRSQTPNTQMQKEKQIIKGGDSINKATFFNKNRTQQGVINNNMTGYAKLQDYTPAQEFSAVYDPSTAGKGNLANTYQHSQNTQQQQQMMQQKRFSDFQPNQQEHQHTQFLQMQMQRYKDGNQEDRRTNNINNYEQHQQQHQYQQQRQSLATPNPESAPRQFQQQQRPGTAAANVRFKKGPAESLMDNYYHEPTNYEEMNVFNNTTEQDLIYQMSIGMSQQQAWGPPPGANGNDYDPNIVPLNRFDQAAARRSSLTAKQVSGSMRTQNLKGSLIKRLQSAVSRVPRTTLNTPDNSNMPKGISTVSGLTIPQRAAKKDSTPDAQGEATADVSPAKKSKQMQLKTELSPNNRRGDKPQLLKLKKDGECSCNVKGGHSCGSSLIPGIDDKAILNELGLKEKDKALAKNTYKFYQLQHKFKKATLAELASNIQVSSEGDMTDDESEVRVGHFENMQVLDLDN